MNYIWSTMKCAAGATKFAAMAFLALGMLLFTGCAKEEVVSPASVHPTLKHSPAQTGNGHVGGTNDRGNDGVNITDDGDDLGDKESTNRPKPN